MTVYVSIFNQMVAKGFLIIYFIFLTAINKSFSFQLADTVLYIVVQELIVYAVYTLFFFGAAINSVIVAAHLAGYSHYYGYGYFFPAAIVAAVTIIQ